MAFEVLKKRNGLWDGPATRSVGVVGVGEHKRTLSVRVSGDIAAQAGLVVGGHCSPRQGTGADIGRLLIAPSVNELDYHLFRPGRGGKQVSVSLPSKTLGVVAPDKTTQVPFEVTPDGLVIDLRSLLKPVAVAA